MFPGLYKHALFHFPDGTEADYYYEKEKKSKEKQKHYTIVDQTPF